MYFLNFFLATIVKGLEISNFDQIHENPIILEITSPIKFCKLLKLFGNHLQILINSTLNLVRCTLCVFVNGQALFLGISGFI